MASYTRLGSFLLAHELAADPFGKVYRGLVVAGSGLERHVLVRTFSEDMNEAGIGGRMEEAGKVAALLAGQRGFGHGYKVEGGRPAYVVCDYIPGRSLAQMIEKAKHEQIPLGVDHALSVLQGVAQALVQLHGKGVSHGVLSPHSVWVSFEGATHLLDAPYAAQAKPLLGRAPIASAALQRYRPSGQASPLHQDLYALGALLYELLTLDKLPTSDLIPATLGKATLKAAQEDSPIPPEILSLLKRLLLVERPFENPSAFSSELERVLYDGDYSPTTFNMAFFMHTLFREENEQDTQAMKADQAADFSPFLQDEPTKRKIFETASGQTYTKYVVWVGVAVAVVVAGFGYFAWSSIQERKKVQAELAELQRTFSQKQAELIDLTRQGQAQRETVSKLEEQKAKAKTAEEKKRLDAELAAARAKEAQIQQQTQQTQQSVAQLQQRTQQIAQSAAVQLPPPPPTAMPRPAQQTAQAAPTGLPAQLPSQMPTNLPANLPRTLPSNTPEPAPAAQQAAPAAAPTAQTAPQNLPANVPAPAGPTEVPGSLIKNAPVTAPRVVNKALIPTHLRNEPVIMRLQVFVDAQGRPQRARVVSGLTGNGLPYEEAAIRTALESTFQAATRDGKPVSSWVPMTVNFGRPR